MRKNVFLLIALVSMSAYSQSRSNDFEFDIVKVREVVEVEDHTNPGVEGGYVRRDDSFVKVINIVSVLTAKDDPVRANYNNSTAISCPSKRIFHRTTQDSRTRNFLFEKDTTCSLLYLCLEHLVDGEKIKITVNLESSQVNQVKVPESCVGLSSDEWIHFSDETGFGSYRPTIERRELL